MIFHESMCHNMRIHVIFLAPYFLHCPNFIRPHAKCNVLLKQVDQKKERPTNHSQHAHGIQIFLMSTVKYHITRLS